MATNSGATQYPWGREEYHERIEHRTWDSEPWKTSMKGSHEIEVSLPGRYTRRLNENGNLLREKNWSETIPRDFQ